MQLLVSCSRPGLGVAGKMHPQFAAYPVGEFSEEQLREMIADRHISIAVGTPLTADGVAAFVAEHIAAPKTAKAK